MVGTIQTWQSTLADTVVLDGVGVHSGASCRVTIRPAGPGRGLTFVRTDLAGPNGAPVAIPCTFDAVSATELCTIVGDPGTGAVSTVEHLLAALRACDVDNAVIELDGPEMPILDGSAAPFVAAIEAAGTMPQAAPRRFVKVLKPVRIERGDSVAELYPHEGFRLDVEIAFDSPLIGRQRYVGNIGRQSFARDLAEARTFGFLRDVDRLRAAGFARGASLENTVVVGEDAVVNPEGLRFPDEFVRHKALDALGDLSLAGLPLLALYRTRRPGHRVNHAVLEALFADPAAWALVDLAPRRGAAGHAEIAGAKPALALAPERI